MTQEQVPPAFDAAVSPLNRMTIARQRLGTELALGYPVPVWIDISAAMLSMPSRAKRVARIAELTGSEPTPTPSTIFTVSLNGGDYL